MKEHEQHQHQHETPGRGDQEAFHERIASAGEHRFIGQRPAWGNLAGASANAADFVGRRLHDSGQVAAAADAIAPGESQQQAKIVNLQQVGELMRFAAGENLLEILEEHFTRDVVTVAMLLQRHARPVRKGRRMDHQNRFVQVGDNGEQRQLDVVAVVSSLQGVGLGDLDRFPDLFSERVRVRYLLPVAAEALPHCQQLLKGERQVFGAALGGGHLLWGHIRIPTPPTIPIPDWATHPGHRRRCVVSARYGPSKDRPC